jgi:hypothetical protein
MGKDQLDLKNEDEDTTKLAKSARNGDIGMKHVLF